MMGMGEFEWGGRRIEWDREGYRVWRGGEVLNGRNGKGRMQYPVCERSRITHTKYGKDSRLRTDTFRRHVEVDTGNNSSHAVDPSSIPWVARIDRRDYRFDWRHRKFLRASRDGRAQGTLQD